MRGAFAGGNKIAVMALAIALAASSALANPLSNSPGWSYEGMHNGQDIWADVSPNYAICEAGTKQSPVVIAFTQTAPLAPLTPQYKETPAAIAFHDEAVELSLEEGNTLTVGNRNYTLKKIRFHTPSEHVVKDKFYPMEVHLIHEDADRKPLIIAIFVEGGNASAAMQKIKEHLPKEKSGSTKLSFDPTGMLPTSLGYYAYSGSLTQPPCTENVEWRILKKPLQATREQMSDIMTMNGRNARLEQPIYARIIHETSF